VVEIEKSTKMRGILELQMIMEEAMTLRMRILTTEEFRNKVMMTMMRTRSHLMM